MVFNTADVDQGINITQVRSTTQDSTHNSEVVSISVIKTRYIDKAELKSQSVNTAHFHGLNLVVLKRNKVRVLVSLQ